MKRTLMPLLLAGAMSCGGGSRPAQLPVDPPTNMTPDIAPPAADPAPTAPQTRREDIVETIHGIEVRESLSMARGREEP